MLVKTLQHTGQSRQQSVSWSQVLVGLGLRNPGFTGTRDSVVETGISANAFSLLCAGSRRSRFHSENNVEGDDYDDGGSDSICPHCG